MYSRYAELRDKRGITDYRVAKETGVTTTTLTNWKQGKYTPKVNKLLSLAKFFDVPVDYFVENRQEVK